jgi:Protein of unknown function (DUF3892)
MSSRQIICTDQTGCSQSGHITAVGLDDTGSDKASERLTVSEVYSAMDRGDIFYTWGGGKVALVHKYKCGCGLATLRSAADATTLNNLDSLRLCRWSAA